MIWRTALATALAAAALGGCMTPATNTVVVSANPNDVTIRFREGYLPDATARANELCGAHGRTAQFQRVDPVGNERLGIFRCV